MTELDDAWVGSAGSPTFPLLDDKVTELAEVTELDDVWVGSAGSSTFPLLDDKVSVLAEVTEASEVAEESGCDSGPLEESSEHATRTPATANAVASFAMKNADVCRAFLLRMGTS